MFCTAPVIHEKKCKTLFFLVTIVQKSDIECTTICFKEDKERDR